MGITDASRVAVAAVAAILLASSPGAIAVSPTGMGVASPYAAVDARNEGVAFENLPGFTRSANERDHALITPESRVYTGLFGWKNTNAAWLVTPSMAGGPQFSMYQVSEARARARTHACTHGHAHIERDVGGIGARVLFPFFLRSLPWVKSGASCHAPTPPLPSQPREGAKSQFMHIRTHARTHNEPPTR